MNRTLLFWLIAIALIALKSTDYIPNLTIQLCVGGIAAIAIFIYCCPIKLFERA